MANMGWVSILLSFLCGALLSTLSCVLSGFFRSNTKEVYHNQANRSDVFILTLISMLAGLAHGLLIVFRPVSVHWEAAILGIVVMQTLALVDHKTGRIPYICLMITFLISIFEGQFESTWIDASVGFLFNLGFGLLIYFIGNAYSRRRYPNHEDMEAFGFGDVIAVTCLGLLLGFPNGFWALVACFGLIAIFHGIQLFIKHPSKQAKTIRMGPYFFAGYLLMLFIDGLRLFD